MMTDEGQKRAMATMRHEWDRAPNGLWICRRCRCRTGSDERPAADLHGGCSSADVARPASPSSDTEAGR
jgi:hypothetical protein